MGQISPGMLMETFKYSASHLYLHHAQAIVYITYHSIQSFQHCEISDSLFQIDVELLA